MFTRVLWCTNVTILTSDKRFGLAGSNHMWLERNKSVGRYCKVSRAVIPTIRRTSFRVLSETEDRCAVQSRVSGVLVEQRVGVSDIDWKTRAAGQRVAGSNLHYDVIVIFCRGVTRPSERKHLFEPSASCTSNTDDFTIAFFYVGQ
jgi:hypothetical protein